MPSLLLKQLSPKPDVIHARITSKFFPEDNGKVAERPTEISFDVPCDYRNVSASPFLGFFESVTQEEQEETAKLCVSVEERLLDVQPNTLEGEPFIESISKSLLEEAFGKDKCALRSGDEVFLDAYPLDSSRQLSSPGFFAPAWSEPPDFPCVAADYPRCIGPISMDSGLPGSDVYQDCVSYDAIISDAHLDDQEGLCSQMIPVDAESNGSTCDIYVHPEADLSETVTEFEGPGSSGAMLMASGSHQTVDIFLEGRALLLGVDNTPVGPSSQGIRYGGALEAIEALVADELQKSWYPLRF